MSKTVIDFDALSYVGASKFSVKHPNPKVKEPIGTITVAGPSHPQVLAFEEAEHRRKFDEDEAYQRARFDAVKDGSPVPPAVPFKSQEELREVGARKLASYVLDADFDVKLNGKVVALSQATAVEIFKSPSYDWIVSPLWQFVNNRENFTPNSADN